MSTAIYFIFENFWRDMSPCLLPWILQCMHIYNTSFYLPGIENKQFASIHCRVLSDRSTFDGTHFPPQHFTYCDSLQLLLLSYKAAGKTETAFARLHKRHFNDITSTIHELKSDALAIKEECLELSNMHGINIYIRYYAAIMASSHRCGWQPQVTEKNEFFFCIVQRYKGTQCKSSQQTLNRCRIYGSKEGRPEFLHNRRGYIVSEFQRYIQFILFII